MGKGGVGVSQAGRPGSSLRADVTEGGEERFSDSVDPTPPTSPEPPKCADFPQGQASAALHFSPCLIRGSGNQPSMLGGGVSTGICFSVAAD